MMVCQREHEQPLRGRKKGRPGWLPEMFRPVDVESFRSQQCRWRIRLHSKRCLRVVMNSIFQPGVVLIFRKIPAWPSFGTRQYCTWNSLIGKSHIVISPFLSLSTAVICIHCWPAVSLSCTRTHTHTHACRRASMFIEVCAGSYLLNYKGFFFIDRVGLQYINRVCKC